MTTFRKIGHRQGEFNYYLITRWLWRKFHARVDIGTHEGLSPERFFFMNNWTFARQGTNLTKLDPLTFCHFPTTLSSSLLHRASVPWVQFSIRHCKTQQWVFDMANPYQYDILSISIFCKIPLLISIFSRMAISISISIFFELSLSISISISIFSKFPYQYFYRYRYFPNFLIDVFSISIFSK